MKLKFVRFTFYWEVEGLEFEPRDIVSRAPVVNLYGISTKASLVPSLPAPHRDALLGSKLMGFGVVYAQMAKDHECSYRTRGGTPPPPQAHSFSGFLCLCLQHQYIPLYKMLIALGVRIGLPTASLSEGALL